MVLESEGPATEEEELTWETIELQRNLATVLPANHKLGQVEAQHPATTYQMFKNEILNEVARCLSMPYNIAAANSSGYNYSSGRLDHQVYDRTLKIEQKRIEQQILDRLFGQWLVEAAFIGLLPPALGSEVLEMRRELSSDEIAWRVPHRWQWDRRPHVDPEKEANAQRQRLQNGTTSRQHEMQEMGLDPEEIDDQNAEGFGIPLDIYQQIVLGAVYTNGNLILNQLIDPQNANPATSGQNPTQEDSQNEQSSET